MTAPDQQEKFRDLKRVIIVSGLIALCIFVFDSLLLGAPMISVFVMLYLFFYIAPVTLFSIKNRPRFMFFGCKLLIYAVLVISSFWFHLFDISIARQRSETVIAAVNQYLHERGHYPESLQALVPAYLPVVPEPRIAPGVFYYGGVPDNPYLMFVEYPPFGRLSWSFVNKEWTSID